MSIIESALLKARKHPVKPSAPQPEKEFSEKLKRKTEEAIVGEVISEEKEATLSRSKLLSSLGMARKQIAGMSQGNVFSSQQLVEKGLVSPSMKDTILLNKYRNLRTKLLSSSNKENFVTLVTSVVPDDANSMIACNLAATFALDEGKTALLIDANINNPNLSQILDIDSEIGLIDYLESDSWSREHILIKTPIPRLRLLPSGNIRVNAAEYFTSDKMKDLIRELVNRYPERFPIIDAPSIIHSADTRILLDLCDKVILVVPYGKCTQEEIKYAALTIGTEKLAGIVLNEF